MTDERFKRETRAAFDDITNTAPEPPSLASITAGRSTLAAEAPDHPRWRAPAAFIGAAAAAVLVVGIAVLVGSGLGDTGSRTPTATQVEQTAESLYGLWVLESYTQDGNSFAAPFSSDGQRTPWIQFFPERVSGNTGCNDFGSSEPPRVENGQLVLGEIMSTLVGCLDANAEDAVMSMFRDEPSDVIIEIGESSFEVTTPKATLVFVRSDRRPTAIGSEWGVTSDDLACADGVALNHRLTDPNATISEMLMAVPGVTSIEERGEFDYSVGYDAEGAAIATLIAGDIEPRQYHRTSCASLWGIKSDANLGGAVATWVNDLGLAQTSTDVWSDRFVEMCATNNGELAPLAARYITEDAEFSLWADGARPPAEQGTEAVETVWRMICAASSFSDDVAEEPLGGPETSLHGVWVLESYGSDDQRVLVEAGVNVSDTPWIAFDETFLGFRETFAAADGFGTAGTFTGNTGCNNINPGIDVTYEFSAGVLVLGASIVEERGCQPSIDGVILSMLEHAPDGIEVVSNNATMTWYGGSGSTPLTFRREGTPPSPPPEEPGASPAAGTLSVFDIDGVEVIVAVPNADHLSELPDRADKVEFTGTIIDSGSGPEICLGGIADSLPPQCGGPIADGLEMGDWAEEAQGVRWGERTVVVSWPAVDGHVQLLDESEAQYRNYIFPPTELPDVCSDIDDYVNIEEIHAYEQTLGDVSGDVYLANDGTLVLQVVGDPQPHRDALATAGRQACVVEVSRSKAEQSRIRDAVVSGLQGLFESYTVSTGAGGRVDIGLPVVDRETVEIVAGLVDDRTAIRLIGRGVPVS